MSQHKHTGKTVSVRSATADGDVEEINDFFNSKPIKQDLHWFTYRDTLERAFRRDDRELFYVDDEDQIIGGLMVWCESRVLDEGDAQIRLVAVHPEHRRGQIATRLCTYAEDFARSQGQSRMLADVSAESSATAFWENSGYDQIESWTTDGDREMVRMVKSLS